jgi:hypothetical protein
MSTVGQVPEFGVKKPVAGVSNPIRSRPPTSFSPTSGDVSGLNYDDIDLSSEDAQSVARFHESSGGSEMREASPGLRRGRPRLSGSRASSDPVGKQGKKTHGKEISTTRLIFCLTSMSLTLLVNVREEHGHSRGEKNARENDDQ